MAGEAFPPIPMRLRYERDPSVQQGLLSDVDTMFDGARAKFTAFAGDASRLIDVALGKGRNSSGALDLDVPALQAAAKAQEQRAIAAREVARATALATQEDRDGSASAKAAAAATDALATQYEQAAISARNYAAAAEQVQVRLNRQASATKDVVNALNSGTTANRALVNSSSAVRQATLQSGQQLQDVAISLYSGQRASIVFAQQLPQLAFALSGLEGSANKTHARIGAFATTLAGPWGLAVGLAVGAGVSLISSLLGIGNEAKKAESKTFDFTTALDFMKLSAGEAQQAIGQLRQAVERLPSIQGDFSNQIAANAEAAIVKARRDVADAEKRLSDIDNAPGLSKRVIEAFTIGQAREELAKARKALADAKAEAQTASLRIAQRSVIEQRDPLQAQLNRNREAVGKLETKRRASIDVERLDPRLRAYELRKRQAIYISEEEYKRELSRLEGLKAAIEKARTKSSKPDPSDPANRQFGREVNSAEARAIAERAGFQVNSADRINARQRELYDAYVAAGRPKDKPVAIPGTSAHERGNALDIQARPGANPASIRKAFEDEGVKLSKILRERNIYHVEFRTTGADRVKREAGQIAKQFDEVKQFGERAADQIANINSRFDEQPRLIDQAAAATRALDDTIRELAKLPGTEKLIADAEKTKETINKKALLRPFELLRRETARRIELDRLVLAGREAEAAALTEIWQLEAQLGVLTQQQRQAVESVVLAREAEYRMMEKLRDQQSAYLDATRSVRAELESLFSGDKVDFGKIFKRLQARVTVEAIFGDSLRALDKTVQSKYDLGAAGIKAEGERVATEFGRVAKAAYGLASAISSPAAMPGRGAANDNSPINPYGDDFGFQKAFFDTLGGPEPDNVPITVTGTSNAEATARGIERSNTALGMTPDAYANMLGVSLVAPLLRGLPPAIAGPLSRILGGAAGGYFTGGVPGAILGLAKGGLFEYGPDIFGKGLNDKLLKGVDGALKGAGTGTLVAGIGNAIGLKLNQTGAQIGGAIGSFIPIPGGQIIGSVAGGLIGNLFGKRPRGAAEVTNASVFGRTNDSGLTKNIISFGTDIQASVKRIADALGAQVGAFDIGIGRYKEFFQVSGKAGDPRLGNSHFGRDSKNALYDGKDPEAAAAAAIAGAIADGAIKGLSATAERILKSTPNIDAAIQKILDFQSVFDRLRAYKDPVGAAVATLDKEFSRLRGIFENAGASTAEYAQLEELYGIERAKAIDEAGKRLTGSLRGLLDRLATGDSGLSLRDRQTNALSQYEGLSARVKAGDVTAYDDYAQKAGDLLDIERQLYGSTKQYFDRFFEVKGLSQSVVDQQQALADQASARQNGPDAGVIKDALDSQTGVLGGKLDQAIALLAVSNDNFVAFARQSAGGAGASLADRYGLKLALS